MCHIIGTLKVYRLRMCRLRMCYNRYIEYTLMYIGYECVGYVEYNEYSFMYLITLPLEYSLYS